jgi:hypothetical protein
MVRWPIFASNFNSRDYTSIQEILSDLELLIRDTLQNKLSISDAHIKVSLHISYAWSSKSFKRITLLF